MNMDNAGKLIPREKVKGRHAAVKRLFEQLQERMDEKATTFINISQADCRADAEALKALISKNYPNVPVRIYSVGAVIGAHSGPGTLALFFLGAPRTA
jgi:fatty acid-binding protein DegV